MRLLNKRLTIDKEADFHDQWALSQKMSDIDIEACFRGCTAIESKYINTYMRKLNGKKVLDIGAGLGESSVYFARQGATVITCDLSFDMLQFSEKLARHHNVVLQRVQSLGDTLPFSSDCFDIVYLSNVLHHITDIDIALKEIKRVLKDGGIMVSIDPIAYNPVINIYRKIADRVRTEDEHPLTRKDLHIIKSYFPGAKVRMFWLLTLIIFIKFFFLDKIHPNEQRYWKRIYKVEKDVAKWFKPLSSLDQFIIHLLPPLKWLCWNMVVIGRKVNKAV